MFGSTSRRKGRRSAADREKSSGRGSSEAAAAAAVKALFDKYAEDDDPMVIGMEGIDTLCTDVGIDAGEDVRGLVLLWKLGLAKGRPGQITLEEWQKGCAANNIDSIDKLKAIVPSLDTGFLEHNDFRDLYKFVFQFNREGTHRTIDREFIISLFEIVFKGTGRVPPERLESFTVFLRQYAEGEKVTLDQWMNFLEFGTKHPTDIDDYDENGAWPIMIDDYVEYLKEKK